jgi:signal transduction histidine kinase
MRKTPDQHDIRAVTRVAQHVWMAVAFVFAWMHFSSVRPHLDWRVYSLYFLAVAGIACRYLTGMRYGYEPWHRVVFDGLSILFISLGVGLTGGIHSELWLLYFIFVIAETLAASARGFLITDVAAMASYAVATWPTKITWGYGELLLTRIFFLVLVASIARTIAGEERRREADLGGLREALSVSEERRRLARDLHDGIGHVLTRVILSLEVARRLCGKEPEGAAESIAHQANALRGAMEEMRQIVATLRTDTSAFDLQTAVRAFIAQLEDTGSLEVSLEMPGEPLPLSSHRQYHLARVIQEALTNSLRHSRASHAEVEIRVVDAAVGIPKVVARVSDAGAGFEPGAVRSGHGLKGMAERLAAYGGKVRIDSSPGSGTAVTAELASDLELEALGIRVPQTPFAAGPNGDINFALSRAAGSPESQDREEEEKA